MGSMNMVPSTPRTSPQRKAEKKATEIMDSASSRFCWPSRRETVLPEPWPKVKPMAWMTAIRGRATPTAAVALVPICPTK